MPKTRQQALYRGLEPENSTRQSVPTGNNLCKEFWEEQPKVWFNLLERKFNEYEVPDELQTSLLLSRLTQKALLTVQDLIETDVSYEQLKARLLNHFDQTTQQKVTKLFSNPPQTNKRPSEILAELRSVFPSKEMTDEALKPLFISRLPYFVQLQLSARFAESLPQLVREADGIAGFVNCSQTMHPLLPPMLESSVNAVNDGASSSSFLTLKRENEQLKKQILQLQDKLDGDSMSKQYSEDKPYRPNYDKSRRFSKKGSDSNAANQKYETSTKALCFYHFKFGANANKCQSPCKWSEMNSKN